jgi:hypothetical protein
MPRKLVPSSLPSVSFPPRSRPRADVAEGPAPATPLASPSTTTTPTISGRAFGVSVFSSDDHAVKEIKLYLHGEYMSTTTCENIGFRCQLYYEWSVGGPGPRTARFEATDFMEKTASETVDFTVG